MCGARSLSLMNDGETRARRHLLGPVDQGSWRTLCTPHPPLSPGLLSSFLFLRRRPQEPHNGAASPAGSSSPRVNLTNVAGLSKGVVGWPAGRPDVSGALKGVQAHSAQSHQAHSGRDVCIKPSLFSSKEPPLSSLTHSGFFEMAARGGEEGMMEAAAACLCAEDPPPSSCSGTSMPGKEGARLGGG